MKQKWKTFGYDIAADILGSILYAAGLYTFASNADFAPGGISGLAIMMNHVWHLPIGIMTFLMNIPFILISYRYVGKEFLLKSLRTVIISTFFLDVVFPLMPAYGGARVMAALFSGVCLGAGMAIFYMRGTSSGGIDLLVMTVKVLRPHLSMGIVTLIIDFAIILIGWPVFGDVDAVLYGITATFVASIVMDKIMYGMGAGTLTIIITTKGNEVCDRISEIIDRGSTLIRGMGSYTLEKKDVILCACSKSQAYKVKSTVMEVDGAAFVMFTETSQVFGEGFLSIED